MTNIFYLDWTVHRLYGWEKTKGDLSVVSIIKGIELGDDFPPVPVTRENFFSFYLTPIKYTERDETSIMTIDGGHHRAVGHYIAGAPLKCELIQTEVKPRLKQVEIPDIQIITEPMEVFLQRKTFFPAYRFCDDVPQRK